MTIIAISGSGRSGSTVVSLLLSQGKRVFNLGQMRHLAGAWAANASCSCGRGVRSCPVYGAAVPAAFGSDPNAGLAKFGISAGRFVDDAARLGDWGDAATRSGLRIRHATFLDDLAVLLGSIAEVTNSDAFVDSSKLPEMALAFDLAQPSRLRVLNLVRDPRAVAVSWHNKNPSLAATLRNARIWRARQRRLADWSKSLGERIMTMRYEDFARHPKVEIRATLNWAGLEFPSGLFTAPDRARVEWEGQHLFPPANETVLAERRTDVSIRPSDGWRAPVHSGIHRIAMAMGWPEARRHYPVRDDTL